MSLNHILFITHDCSKTGAPIVLLQFMSWIKKNHHNVGIELLALKGGPLKKDFVSVVDKFYEPKPVSSREKFGRKFFSVLGIRPTRNLNTKHLKKLSKNKYDLIYANTVGSLSQGIKLKQKLTTGSLVLHTHELQTVTEMICPELKSYLPDVDHFISVSKMVTRNLITNYSIPETKIKEVYEFTDLNDHYKKITKNRQFRVGAAGNFHWRKGNDIYIQVIRYIFKHFPDVDIEFVWVGNTPKVEHQIAIADLQKLGLKEKLTFTGLLDNPGSVFKSLDVFLLPSREDPFPLVCIEVGKMGVPIICFKDATGISEVISSQEGAVVPYLDIESMAKGVMNYYSNKDIRLRHGEQNKEIFAQFVPQIQCPKIFETLENL